MNESPRVQGMEIVPSNFAGNHFNRPPYVLSARLLLHQGGSVHKENVGQLLYLTIIPMGVVVEAGMEIRLANMLGRGGRGQEEAACARH